MRIRRGSPDVIADEPAYRFEWYSVALWNEFERFLRLLGCAGTHSAWRFTTASAFWRAELIRNLRPLNCGRISGTKFINQVWGQRGYEGKRVYDRKSLAAALKRTRPKGRVGRHLDRFPSGDARELMGGIEIMID